MHGTSIINGAISPVFVATVNMGNGFSAYETDAPRILSPRWLSLPVIMDRAAPWM